MKLVSCYDLLANKYISKQIFTWFSASITAHSMVKGNIEIGLNTMNLWLDDSTQQDKSVGNKWPNQWLPTGQYLHPVFLKVDSKQ